MSAKIDTPVKIGLILLAAGASTRMGTPKQLLSFQGRSLLRISTQTALATNCNPVIVVTGANRELVEPEIRNLPVVLVHNAAWESGMASSIGTGISRLVEINPDIKAALITLCDQPLITSEFLRELINNFTQTHFPIIAAQYNDIAGVPALFSRHLFEELRSLKGQEGARKLIAAHPSEVKPIPCPEAAFDIDTPEDYRNLPG